MSLKKREIPPIPEETERIVRAAFPKGSVFVRMRDELGSIYADEHFADLFSPEGQPAVAPWRLALVTVMQFVENLTDRQAAEAVQARLDWKYALSLKPEDSGFHYSVLCEFRRRLVEGEASLRLLEILLEQFKAKGLVKAGGKQRTDSTHVLAAVRVLNRLECVGETLRAALEQLAEVAPDWLLTVVSPDWFMRYALPFETSRLSDKEAARMELVRQIGADGYQLLQALGDPLAPDWLGELWAVRVLRQVWIQQFYGPDQAQPWRQLSDVPPCAKAIHSPYDVEARYSCKQSTVWTGYKVHVTETCDAAQLSLITDVQTTPGTVNDQEVTLTIQDCLSQRDLKPESHLMDTAYIDAQVLVTSQENQIEVIGRVVANPSWQARAGQGYEADAFQIDWDTQTALCPQGQISSHWQADHTPYQVPVIRIRFTKATCQACQARDQCTRSRNSGRTLVIHDQPAYAVMKAARQRQTSEAFRLAYRQRAGIEGTHSQAVNAFGLRFARYKGLAKTRLQHIATAVAINLVRFSRWLEGKIPAQTRSSRFARLGAVLA